MTIAKDLKRNVVIGCLTAFCALGIAGKAEAHHHHKESRGRQAAGIIHAVADTIRAVTGQGYVVPAAPAVVAPTVVATPTVVAAPVVAPTVIAPPVVVTPSYRTPGVINVSRRPGVTKVYDTGMRPTVIRPSLRTPGVINVSRKPGITKVIDTRGR